MSILYYPNYLVQGEAQCSFVFKEEGKSTLMSSAVEPFKMAKIIISSSIQPHPLPKQTFILGLLLLLVEFVNLCFSLILQTMYIVHHPVRDTSPTQVSRMSYDLAINDP